MGRPGFRDPMMYWIWRELGPGDIREEIFAKTTEWAFAEKMFALAIQTFPDEKLFLTKGAHVHRTHPPRYPERSADSS